MDYKKLIGKFGWIVMQLSLTCTDDEKTYKYENFLHYIKKLNHIKTKMKKLLVDKKMFDNTTEYYDLQVIKSHLEKFILKAAEILKVSLTITRQQMGGIKNLKRIFILKFYY